MRKRKCKNCGKPYEPNRKWQKYCKPDCRVLAYWKKKVKK